MSWLSAHETYVTDIIARDRAEELRATPDLVMDTERVGPPSDPPPDARFRTAAAWVLSALTLAKAWR
jgi:hypothetical protein